MPMLTVKGRQCYYETTGVGFPLLLTAGRRGTIAAWREIMPLLGEMCKTIAYEYCGIASTACQADRMWAEDCAALLDALGTTRVYLAALGSSVPMALSFALHAPARLEGLLLVGMSEDPVTRVLSKSDAPHRTVRTTAGAESLSTLAVPTLILVGDQVAQQRQRAVALAARLPRAQVAVIVGAGCAPQHEQPRRLGHAMMDFLMHCERQRNLVRGASLLL
jgi:pimeloyl-ACP methyl ester carboxylesterase